jgi:hypothetical protein
MAECLHCNVTLKREISTKGRKILYCSTECGWKFRGSKKPRVTEHECRNCGKVFPIYAGQNQKWLCSDDCRRERVSKITREWRERNPDRETLYRQRSKEKQLPDSNLLRFRRWNADAPSKCESCGEHRVLDIAHKPGYERNGQWRNSKNCKWPEMVWVLCPTCHALLDRMRYSPEELGLRV